MQQPELFSHSDFGIEAVLKSIAKASPNKFEAAFRNSGMSRLAGVDEVGRGPLAGPVVACACVLPQKSEFIGLTDSKLLSSNEIERLHDEITTSEGVDYSIGIVDADEIDRINILQATILAMQQAIDSLHIPPEFVVVDGNRSLPISIPCATAVKGDRHITSVCAASVIAKFARDELMRMYHRRWPEYGFAEHKGYGTAFHLEKLKEFGPCPIHRKSFAPVIEALSPQQLILL